MTEESVPRGYAVLAPSAKPYAPDAGGAWASLSALGACITFWSVVAFFVC